MVTAMRWYNCDLQKNGRWKMKSTSPMGLCCVWDWVACQPFVVATAKATFNEVWHASNQGFHFWGLVGAWPPASPSPGMLHRRQLVDQECSTGAHTSITISIKNHYGTSFHRRSITLSIVKRCCTSFHQKSITNSH